MNRDQRREERYLELAREKEDTTGIINKVLKSLDWICVGLDMRWTESWIERERYLQLAREREDTVVTMTNKQLARLIETDRYPWRRCRINVEVGGVGAE